MAQEPRMAAASSSYDTLLFEEQEIGRIHARLTLLVAKLQGDSPRHSNGVRAQSETLRQKRPSTETVPAFLMKPSSEQSAPRKQPMQKSEHSISVGITTSKLTSMPRPRCSVGKARFATVKRRSNDVSSS